jgi:hypothetical protein
MQISGVSLALTWPRRLCLLRFLLCVSLCYKLSPFQALGKVTLHPCCQAYMFIYSSCGRWVFPLSCAVFLLPPLSQAFLLLITGQCCCSCQPPCLFTAHWEVGLPSSPEEFSSLHHSHKPSRSWLLGARPAPAPTRGSPAHLACLFTVPGRIPFPQSSELRAPHPLSSVSLLLIAYYSLSLFSSGGGQSVQGSMLLWPRLVCGSTMVP